MPRIPSDPSLLKPTVKPDWKALREQRDKNHAKIVAELSSNLGVDPSTIHMHSSGGCYCDCGSDPPGPCEHIWSGPTIEMYEGSCITVTCAKCGMPAVSHDMRYGP